MAPGYLLRDIKPTDAEYMAKYWIPATTDYPLEIKTQFIKDIAKKFIMLGIYEAGNDGPPVSWFGQKPGKELSVEFCRVS